MDEPQSICRCTETSKARNINAKTYGHIHCPCDVCRGEAAYPTTAWRHSQRSEIERLRHVTATTCDTDCDGDPSTDTNMCTNTNETITMEASSSYFESPPSQSGANLAIPNSDSEENSGDESQQSEDWSSEGEGEDDAQDDPHEEIGGNDGEQNVREFIRDAVLRLVEMKGQNGLSITSFEELLRWGKDLHCHNNGEARDLWPSSWIEVKDFLEQLGFRDPKLYWICLDSSHPCLYGLMQAKDQPCPHCGNQGTIPYYYLSLADKVQRWCSSPAMCREMTAHWNEKDHWILPEMKHGWGFPVKKELWDGKRFAQLSYFWDPEEAWGLPARCPQLGCGRIVSHEQQLRSPSIDGNPNQRRVTCPSCLHSFIHILQFTHGDPRNLAYIGNILYIIFRVLTVRTLYMLNM